MALPVPRGSVSATLPQPEPASLRFGPCPFMVGPNHFAPLIANSCSRPLQFLHLFGFVVSFMHSQYVHQVVRLLHHFSVSELFRRVARFVYKSCSIYLESKFASPLSSDLNSVALVISTPRISHTQLAHRQLISLYRIREVRTTSTKYVSYCSLKCATVFVPQL